MSNMAQRRHELLSDLADCVAAELKDYGISDALADQCGVATANRLAEHWGGQLISFPKDISFQIAARDLEIYALFKGGNHAELARQFGLTQRSVYRIINRVRKSHIGQQGDLFD